MKRSNRMRHTLGRWISQGLVAGPLAFVLVAAAGCPSLFDSDTQRATRIREAQVGRDGPKTVTELGVVLNTYAALSGDATRNTRVVSVTSIANLNLRARFENDLAKGDLILIIQMAGATINTAATDADYGEVTEVGNAGRYEFAGVESVSGNNITVTCPLKNDYNGPTGKAQVVRVPQYTTLTVATGASITADPWSRSAGTGGVVAIHGDTTTLQSNGQITVTGMGFHGGARDNSTAAAGSNVVTYRSTQNTQGGEKGEGIGGDATVYQDATGAFGRGAPANGGGGGDSHNAGGGGGANARHGTSWTGQGVMLSTVTGNAAWQFDPGYQTNPAGANTLTTSEGGGRGGYSYSNANLNATTAAGAPGQTGWSGDNRREVGGLGGRSLANDPTARLYMGGGGGAGDGNNGVAGPGGNGGGIVFLIAGSLAGNGRIVANGDVGGDVALGTGNASDAAGGGGGGGSIVVHAASIASTISVTANGGRGGNQTAAGAAEAEGPGGGGGGGYIAVSGGAPARTAAGGDGGATVLTGPLGEFPSNGATAGNSGQTDGDATSFLYCGMLADAGMPETNIETHPTDPSVSPAGSFTFSSNEGGAHSAVGVVFQCDLDSQGWSACGASYTTPVLADGHHTLSVRAVDLSNNVDPTPAVFAWDVIAGAADGGALDSGEPDTLVRLDVEEDTGPRLDVEEDTTPPALDVGIDLGANDDVEPVLLDAEGVDLLEKDDVPPRRDVPGSDLRLDAPAKMDTPPIQLLDGALDSQERDARVADLGPGIDGIAGLDGALQDATPIGDAGGALPEAGADSAGAPEPNPDTSGPITKDDVAPNPDVATGPDTAIAPTNNDAATTPPDDQKLVVMGGGFCAISPTRAPSAATFALLALAGLALLRRRRSR
jgi:MYXO-CTERM domain-containing protein